MVHIHSTRPAWDPFPRAATSNVPPQEDTFVTRCRSVPEAKDPPLRMTLSDGNEQRHLPCTRSALAAGSEVFARMFDADWREARESASQQVPCLGAAEAVLKYLHGEPLALHAGNVVDTSVMANYWDIPPLREACHTYLEKKLTAENLCHYFNAACEVDDAAPGLSSHIWQCAGMLGLVSDACPSDTAVQWLQDNPTPMPSQTKTVVQYRPSPDVPRSYDLRLRWFEPHVLPDIGQGQSATWDIDGLQLHIKRIVQRIDSLPLAAAFDLRIQIPTTYPSQGAIYRDKSLQAVHQFSFDYTLAPNLVKSEPIPQRDMDDNDTCPEAAIKGSGSYGVGLAARAQYAHMPRPQVLLSDDEGDAYRVKSLSLWGHGPKVRPERTLRAGNVEHSAEQVGHIGIRLWQVNLDGLQLSQNSGIFRADGSQFLQVDGTLRAVDFSDIDDGEACQQEQDYSSSD